MSFGVIDFDYISTIYISSTSETYFSFDKAPIVIGRIDSSGSLVGYRFNQNTNYGIINEGLIVRTIGSVDFLTIAMQN